MNDPYARFRILIGDEAAGKLRNSRVAVFGLGGVGGNAAEALVRSGIGAVDLIDHDEVSLTNINRQVFATRDTVGMKKTEAAVRRLSAIDPDTVIRTYPVFYLPETRDMIPFDEWDYIVDAIDTVSAKIDIIMTAHEKKIPVISAMGCGNRLDPAKLCCMDLADTKNDPLARVMRRELRKRGIAHLKVVCSTELPLHAKAQSDEQLPPGKRSIPGSSAFVPPAAGILIASQVVKDLITEAENEKKG